MTDIQLIDFRTVTGLKDAYVILVQSGGEGAKIHPSTFLSLMTADLRPSIKDRLWYIGPNNTNVIAEGKTPVMSANGSILVWGYENEPTDKILADLRDYVFKFSDLSPEEIDRISLHYSQLTPSQIAELQKPANDAIAAVNIARQNAETATANANTATENANTATTNADSARDKAVEVAAHPTYVGTDFYIYEYDLATHQYNKTEKLVKAAAFNIDYNFASMSELLANQPTGKSDGLFAIINTQDTEDEDNAKLFISKGGRWQYVVDMSGFRGFQGYTPQLSVGNIVVGDNRNDASITLSENGRDAKNNPKFNVNFRIPTFAFSDFTNDEILLLQKPAIDKAAEVQLAEDSRVLAENARKEAESTRTSSEQTRILNENTRQENETTRKSNETTRQSNEQKRESNEQTRISNEDTRKTNETTRLSNEDTRKSNENTRLSNEESRESNEAIRKAHENTRESNEESRKSAENTREDNEAIRKSNEQSRVNAENRRVAEVDSLIHRLEEFDVTIFEERLHFLEQNATCIGEIVGEDDEVDFLSLA